MSIDTIGNFLTIIRNGIMIARPYVVAPHSKVAYEIAIILKDEGLIRDVIVEEITSVKKQLKIFLKYVQDESVIHEIKRISTPGKRIYKSIETLDRVIGGLGIAILTTNRGFMTDKKARSYGIGGELVCEVW